MINFSSKETVDYEVAPGAVIRVDLLRPLFDEGPQIVAVVFEHTVQTRAMAKSMPKPIETTGEAAPVVADDELWATAAKFARLTADAASAIPRPLVERIFRDYVRNPRDGNNEPLLLDGAPIEKAEQLLGIADLGFVKYVIDSLHGLCRMSVAEGKESSSPSTSAPTPTESSAPDATSTDDRSGTALSTAPEIPHESESSIEATP